MADFIFRISPNIVLGSYTLSRIGQYAREYGVRFLVVMDPILKEVNLADKLLQPLSDRSIDYFVFSEFSESADTKTIERVLNLARDGHIHGIIAAGGSKVLNMGCAVASLYNENHNLYDYVDGAVPTTSALPLICVPTTIREPFIYTAFTPVVDSRSHQIKLLKGQNGLCKLAVLDPNLTLTLSENQNISMLLETMCLALEAYLSQKASFFSDMLIEKAVELIGYVIVGSPSLEITTPVEILKSQAGCMASLGAATSSPGLGTLLALCINSRFNISRSLVLSILFPFIIEDAGKFKTERVERLARISRIIPDDVHGEEAVLVFAENIRQQLAKANLPTRLKDLSVSVEQLALAAEDAGQLEIANMLPRSMTADDLFDFIKSAY
ncbi:MAG: iron-containing alcohol dehydrogenase [Treponema sp.]|nr:iron-containing alcohol dehydrogenase [Treponema sp.]